MSVIGWISMFVGLALIIVLISLLDDDDEQA